MSNFLTKLRLQSSEYLGSTFSTLALWLVEPLDLEETLALVDEEIVGLFFIDFESVTFFTGSAPLAYLTILLDRKAGLSLPLVVFNAV